LIFESVPDGIRLTGYALDELFSAEFKELDDLLAGDGWEVFKELVDG
jgi:hypothetical protein